MIRNVIVEWVEKNYIISKLHSYDSITWLYLGVFDGHGVIRIKETGPNKAHVSLGVTDGYVTVGDGNGQYLDISTSDPDLFCKIQQLFEAYPDVKHHVRYDSRKSHNRMAH